APKPLAVGTQRIERAAEAMRGEGRTCVLLGGRALREHNLAALGAIAEAHDLTLMCATFPTRLARGEGRVPVQRLPYFAEQALEALAPFRRLVLLGTAAPVSFFAYPDKESWLTPEHCELILLAEASEDIDSTIKALVDKLAIDPEPKRVSGFVRQDITEDALTPLTIGQVVTNELPEQAIVCDEGNTSSLPLFLITAQARAHDWLTLTGGAIGQGLPLALGAALACPERKVVALEADGSAMYTIQALWSMARENADVTVVLFNNSSYAILNIELARVGAGEGNTKTLSMLDLSNPSMSFASIAEGLGVPATQARSAAEFQTQFRAAMRRKGPQLIEAIL
ncbi:MAG: acetolactate synthase large subunit, partial [Halieaceae bacterium]|nr:acetolactate synthase large subunit [Halieaceae bacterium]